MGRGIRIGEARCDVLGIAVTAKHPADAKLLRPLLFRQTLLNCFQVLETVLKDGLFDVGLRDSDGIHEDSGDAPGAIRNRSVSFDRLSLRQRYGSLRGLL